MFRIGRKIERTIYFQLGEEPSDDDILLGMMDTPYIAKFTVEALNSTFDRDSLDAVDIIH